MKQLNLNEYIEKADEICDLLTKANVGNARSGNMTLKEKFHYELLKFAIYIADADNSMDDKEIDIIRENLKIEATVESLKEMKARENVDYRFGDSVPESLKYAVLADAGRKVTPDPYRGQKAMIFYDSFKLFGQTMLSAHAEEAGSVTMSRFTAYINRMENFIKEYAVWYAGSQKMYYPMEPVAEEQESEEEKLEKLDALLEQLNSLVGLTGVKHQVKRLLNLIQVQKMREAQGMKCTSISKHMVFAGNPGTGKTTVARLLADIYKYMGVLPKGQLVEVDRSGLVRGYIGQTATRTQEVIEEAMGGVLFVDEAYTLTVNKGEGDFGQEAVDTLLKAMEDHRDEMVVIVAGYTDLMEEFLCSNPGLKSRFSNYILFEDYTADELMEILKSMINGQEYVLSEAAEQRAGKIIEERIKNKPDNFANARDVRNLMEKAIGNHAMRVVSIKDADKKVLETIEPEDLEDF